MWNGQILEKGPELFPTLPNNCRCPKWCTINCRKSYAWDLGLFMASPPGLALETLRVWMRLCVCV